MAIHKLDDTTLRNAKEGVYSDGGNLFLRVRKSGSKAWVFRHKVDGKPREIGMGSYPAKSLKDARRDAAKMRAAIANGTDPAHVITPPVIAEKKTFKSTNNVSATAKLCKCSYFTANDIIRKEKSRENRERRQSAIHKAKQLSAAQMPTRDIARIMGKSPETIRLWLKKA